MRIACNNFIGLIGIASSDRIVGAVTKDEKAAKLTNADAVDKLLSMTQGTFEYYEVPQKELSRLDQNLGMDITELLAKYASSGEVVDSNGHNGHGVEVEETYSIATDTSAVDRVDSVYVDDAANVEDVAGNAEIAVELHEPEVVAEADTPTLSASESFATEAPGDFLGQSAPEVTHDLKVQNQLNHDESASEATSQYVDVPSDLYHPQLSAESEQLDEHPDPPPVEARTSALTAEEARMLDAIPDVSSKSEGAKAESPRATGSLLAKFKEKKAAAPSQGAESNAVAGSPPVVSQSISKSNLPISEAPQPFDPATDELTKNAQETVARIKKEFRKPEAEAAADAERAQRMKFASSRKSKNEVEEVVPSPEPEIDTSRMRPISKDAPKAVTSTKGAASKVSPKVGIAFGVVAALGITFFVTRGAAANFFVNSAEGQFNKRDYAAALSTLSPAFVFDSGNGKAHFLKGQILLAQGDKAKAFDEYEDALKANPQDGEILRAHAILAWHTNKFKVLKADTDNLIANDPTAKTDGYLYGLRAKAELALGDYQSAINDCTTALKLGQKTPWIYSRRGWAYTLKGNPKSGLKDFATALSFPKKDEQTAETYVGKAEALKALNDTKGALDCYEEAFKLNDKVADYYARRASLYNWLKNPDKAMQDYNQALKVDPSFTPAHIGKADICSAQNKFDEALKELNSVPKKYETADVTFAKARVFMRKNDLKNAVAMFKQGLSANSKSPYNYLDLAYCLSGLRNYKEAVAAVQSAIDLQPNNASFRAWHGFYLQCAGQLVSAEKDYEQALSMDSKNADAHFWRAGLFEGRGENSSAIQDYQAALASNPGNAEARKRLAVLTKVDRHSSATTSGTTVDKVTIIQGDFKTLMAQGYAKMKARDARSAVNYFASAVAQDPSSMQARKYLAYALVMKGNNIDAIAQLQAIESSGTIDPGDLRTLGNLLVGAGRYGDAVEVCLKLLTLNPRDTEARLKLAESYSKSGNMGKGLDTLDEGRKLDPGGTARYNALAERLKKGEMRQENGRPEGGNEAG